MDTKEVKEKKNWLAFGKELLRRFKDHNVQDFGATLAFFGFYLFSQESSSFWRCCRSLTSHRRHSKSS
ncbi:hypothetical protein [Exiguobacterium sp. AB2]|uniref:hypothetical protein n=1 Tax=Exiguobacterium sp. AB2 TaxID=1484479 RepID=UPI000ABA44C8|nr:hypothetical protein [Exiguobacterium sp. AB2]